MKYGRICFHISIRIADFVGEFYLLCVDIYSRMCVYIMCAFISLLSHYACIVKTVYEYPCDPGNSFLQHSPNKL